MGGVREKIIMWGVPGIFSSAPPLRISNGIALNECSPFQWACKPVYYIITEGASYGTMLINTRLFPGPLDVRPKKEIFAKSSYIFMPAGLWATS